MQHHSMTHTNLATPEHPTGIPSGDQTNDTNQVLQWSVRVVSQLHHGDINIPYLLGPQCGMSTMRWGLLMKHKQVVITEKSQQNYVIASSQYVVSTYYTHTDWYQWNFHWRISAINYVDYSIEKKGLSSRYMWGTPASLPLYSIHTQTDRYRHTYTKFHFKIEFLTLWCSIYFHIKYRSSFTTLSSNFLTKLDKLLSPVI